MSILDSRLLPTVDAEVDWPALERRLRELGVGGDRARSLPLLKAHLLQLRLRLDDEAAAAEIGDRLSLRGFCGLTAEEPAPSAAELRAWRGQLAGSAEGEELLRALAGRWARRAEPLLSVVSPVYRAEEIVDELIARVVEEAARITPDFELVLVDDGSPDRVWERIQAGCARDPRIKGIRLSRNFGQHLAITAGLDHAAGRWVVVMDCDLQDDPRYLRELYAKAQEGFDIVYTVKERRAHGPIKNLFGRLFAAGLTRLSEGREVSADVGAFSILSRRAVAAFQQVRETHRHYLVVLRWLGFRSAAVTVQHRQRHRGSSSYDARRLLRHAIDGFTAQSNRLLYAALGFGALFLCASLLAAGVLVSLYFLQGFREGWTSTIVLILLSTSAILFSIGTVGIYIGKIFDQVKQRPLYLTQEKLNL